MPSCQVQDSIKGNQEVGNLGDYARSIKFPFCKSIGVSIISSVSQDVLDLLAPSLTVPYKQGIPHFLKYIFFTQNSLTPRNPKHPLTSLLVINP